MNMISNTKNIRVFSKKLMASCLIATLFPMNTTLALASQIDVDKTKTPNTVVAPNDSKDIFNIHTTHTNSAGNVGVNAFNKFNVSQGHTVNFNLINKQTKLVNLIFDDSASQINGIINAYKSGVIGGDLLFANTNGFVVGPTGVLNAGSITLMTPSTKDMENVFHDGIFTDLSVADGALNKLISFEIDNKNYLVTNGVEINPAGTITIDGKINAEKGINLIAGKNATINGSLNLYGKNTQAAASGQNLADTLKNETEPQATPQPDIVEAVVNTGKNSRTLAMNNGNGIVIVATNDGSLKEHENLGAIVNINGKINSGNFDTIIKSESTHANSNAIVNVNSGSTISGNNVDISAMTKVTDFNDNLTDIDNSGHIFWEFEESIRDLAKMAPEAIAENFYHGADLKSAVNIESGAQITAAENLDISSNVNAELDSSGKGAIVGVNVTDLSSTANTIVKNGAVLNAKNLTVDAQNDIQLNVSNEPKNIDKNTYGSAAVTVSVVDVDTTAEIQKGANLNVSNDITVNADTKNYFSDNTKNKGTMQVGFGIAVSVIEADTLAIMNADTDIAGDLNVNSLYSGNITSSVSVSAGGAGEDGALSKWGKTLVKNVFFEPIGPSSGTIKTKVFEKLNDIKYRGNASFNKFELTGAIDVAINSVNTSALIGSVSENIKPTIQAGTVNVNALSIDDKSNMNVSVSADNAKTSIGGAVAVNYKDINTKANVYGDFTLTNQNSTDNDGNVINAMNINSKTAVLHPLSYADWWSGFANTFKDIFTQAKWSEAVDNMHKQWDNMDFYGDSPSSYLQYINPLGEFAGVAENANMNLITNGLTDTSSFGIKDLFNTYAQAAVNAKTTEDGTKAFAGAFSVGVFDVASEAKLVDDSTVTLKTAPDAGNISIKSDTQNEVWTMSSLISPLNFTEVLAGSGARDGSGFGAGVAFTYSDSTSKALIGDNVTISHAEGYGAGDILIDSQTKGNYANISVGSSKADNTGMSGAVNLTLIGGETESSIGKGSNITAGDLTVNAHKDANYINGTVAIAVSEASKGFGISGIGLYDSVKSIIDGTVMAGNIDVKADYDKLLVNMGTNVSVAKTGSDTHFGDKDKNAQDVLNNGSDDDFSLAGTFLQDLFLQEDMGKLDRVKYQLKSMEEAANQDFNFERTINPDKQTSAYAGNINGNIVNSTIEAKLGSNADIQSQNDISISAKSEDLLINSSNAVSANGKSGGGAALTFDAVSNNISAGIDAGALVDAKEQLSIIANEDFKTIQVSTGIAQAKDSSGAGNVSSVVQANNIAAYIGKNAEINQRLNSNISEVILNAKNEALTVKFAGDTSIQAGSGTTASQKAAGATIDGNVVANTVSATIDGANINASKKLSVNAENTDKFIGVDLAASAATGSNASAYSGIAAANVNVNTVEAHIKDSKINENNTQENLSVDVSAQNHFSEIVVGGVGAGGKSTSAGATVRVDVVANEINSYIENSILNASGDIKLTNNETLNQISVMATGAGSTDKSAGAGVISSIFAFSEQNNYIKDSTLNIGSLNLDTDKKMDTIAVTGALAVGLGGSSLGASVYMAGIDHNIQTYIENSSITAKNNITLDTFFDQDYTGVVIGGAGGKGLAGSGALNFLVNTGSIDTKITGDEDNKSTVTAQNGKINLKSEADIDTVAVEGQASISTQGSSAGAASTLTIYKSSISAGIDNAIISSTGLDVLATATENHINTTIGASGSAKTAIEGSIDTYGVDQRVNAYIKNSAAKIVGDVSVKAEDHLDIVTNTGAAAISTSASGAGGSMLNAVIAGETKAEIINTIFEQETAGTLSILANQSDKIQGVTVSGAVGGQGAGIAGTVGTVVNSKDVTVNIDNVQNTEGASFKEVIANAKSTTEINKGLGTLSGGSTAGVGGSVDTLVINKKTESKINNSTITSRSHIKNSAKSTVKVIPVLAGLGGGGKAAVEGAVGTQVLNADANAEIKGSILDVRGVLENNAENNVNTTVVITTASGAGTAAIGGTVYSLSDTSDATATISSSTIKNANSVTNNTTIDNTYDVYMVNAAGAGNAAVNGAVNTIVVNNKSTGLIENSILENIGALTSNAKNLTDINLVIAQANGAGTAAIGGGVSTIISAKNAEARITGTTITAENAVIGLNAENSTNILPVVAGASAAGTAALVGSVNTVISNNTTEASVSSSDMNIKSMTLNAKDETTLSGGTGSATGSGTAAVGGAIFTGVLNNNTLAFISNSDISSIGDILISAITNEIIGSASAPIVTVAGGGSGTAAVDGSINTLILSSKTNAYISGKKNKDIVANNIKINANGTSNLFITAGSAAGAGVAGVAGTVSTVVINKEINAQIENNAKVEAKNLAEVKANTKDNFTTIEIGGGGAGIAGISGVVSTNVINNTVSAKIQNSEVKTKDLDVIANANSKFEDITGSLAVAGAAGVGASVQTNKVSNRVSAIVENSTIKNTNSIDINAESAETFNTYVISGSAGTVGITGAVSTNLVDNNVISKLAGTINEENSKSKITVNAKDDVTFEKAITGGASAGFAGVGASLQTNKVSSDVSSVIGGTVFGNTIDVTAENNQNFNNMYSVGFSGGGGAVSGTSLANIVDISSKAYSLDNSSITSGDLNFSAKSDTDINANAGSASVGAVSAGATVLVNKINKDVEAYTGNNNTITSNKLTLDAVSTIDIGTEAHPNYVIAGSTGLLGSVAGGVLVNIVEDTIRAGIGNSNTISASSDISIKSSDTVNIYEILGTGSGSVLVGGGASVGVNNINNTVTSSIGSKTTINKAKNITISAESSENITADVYAVAAAGAGAIAGGVLVNNIGSKTDKAISTGDSSTDNAGNQGLTQANGVLNQSDKNIQDADNNLTENYNKGIDNANSYIVEAQKNINDNLQSGLNTNVDGSGQNQNISTQPLPDTSIDIEIQKNDLQQQKTATTNSIVRNDSTSAYIDSAVTINNANSLTVNAKNTDNVDIDIIGFGGGFAGAGIAAGVSNNLTTTESFIADGTTINTANNIILKSEAKDNTDINVIAASGGIVSGSGAVAIANSSKTTRTYLLDNVSIKTTNGSILIDTISNALANATITGASFGGITVGASIAQVKTLGENTISFGKNAKLSAGKDIKIKTDSTMKATADADAFNGSLVGGTGADTRTYAGQDARISINSNFETNANGDVEIFSSAKNNSVADANGRAYGGVSVGGAISEAHIQNAKTGVNIQNAETARTIKGNNVKILSNITNTATSSVEAGSGAIVGISGSGANTKITTESKINIGSNYTIESTAGNIDITAKADNTYKAYNNSSSYGVAGNTAGTIRDNITSTVAVSTAAKIISAGDISIIADNNITKAAVNNYDLYGGAGGLAGVGCASLIDTLVMETSVDFAGEKATAGKAIMVAATNNIDVTQKSSVVARGALAVVEGNVKVNSDLKAITTISNKNITSGSDIIYSANSNSSIYSKSNVEAYGLAPVSTGESKAVNKAENKVVFTSSANSVSGTDTYVEAVNTKNIKSYMFANSEGLFWDIGPSSATATNNSSSVIDFNSGSSVNSYDSMNIYATDATGTVKAERTAKTIGHALFGIPITIWGSGGEYESNKSSGSIIVNGDIQSGLGANRELIIDKDGNATGNIKVVGSETLATITTSELEEQQTEEKEMYEERKAELTASKANNDSKRKQILDTSITPQTIAKKALENTNNTLEEENSQLQTNIEGWTTQLATEQAKDNPSQETITQLTNYIENAKQQKESNQEIIDKNKADIETYEKAIAQAQAEYDKLGNNNDTIEASLKILEESYTLVSGEIQKRIDNAKNNGNTIALEILTLENVRIRSGETNIIGNISGSGTITAPGEKYTINITNNSVNDIKYNDLIIDRDIKGGINLNGSNSGVTLATRHTGNPIYDITVKHMVDANDPSVRFDKAGNMLFAGDIENIKGSVNITNWTGSVRTEGSVTSKDLSISVPNGDFLQAFTNSEFETGGGDGTGTILASGDIEVMAKTINVNGKIQSGTDIKHVVINPFNVKKENGKYYQQLGNGEWIVMEKSITDDNWYYIKGDATTGIDYSKYSDLDLIKAYYDVKTGEIQLFKANIQGGNVTLTGNVISSGNGKIVLMSGYGAINVTNNSNYNLVTSKMNADQKMNGKLTIRDFVLSSGDDDLSNLEELYKTNKAEFEKEVNKRAGIYEAYIDENGVLKTKTTAPKDSTLTNDSVITVVGGRQASFTPGTDSYKMVSEAKSGYWYKEYVPRSGFVEFFAGKKYVTKWYPGEPPKYEAKQEKIAIEFKGRDNASIDIKSTGTGDVIIAGQTTVLPGTLTISAKGDIIQKSSSYVATAKNINLYANNIGTEDHPIQMSINGGKLIAQKTKSGEKSNNIYINSKYGDITNLDLKALNNVYLRTQTGNLGGLGSNDNVILAGSNVILEAVNGSIIFTPEHSRVTTDLIKATAANEISIAAVNDLNINYIKANGDINLSSEGAIVAAGELDGIEQYSHIIGKNITLNAAKNIGTSDNAIMTVANGVYNIEAQNDIYLNNVSGDMYIDSVVSQNGDINLTSFMGIINANTDISNSTDKLIRPYNIKGNNLTLNAQFGNIENMNVDLSGNLTAYAGYMKDKNTDEYKLINALSDLQINQISQVTVDSETGTMTESDANNLKDMKIDTVKAGRNVVLKSEKSILSADTSKDNVTGQQIVLSAQNGSIGSADKHLNINATKDVTAYAGDSVSMTSEGDMRVNEIRNTHTQNNNEDVYIPLNNVNLTSKTGSILNLHDNAKSKEESLVRTLSTNIASDGDTSWYNIVSKNMNLQAAKTIGTSDTALKVYTFEDDNSTGLSVTAGEMFVTSADDLKVSDTNVDTAIIAGSANVEINNTNADNILVNSTSAEINNSTVTNTAEIETSEKTTINNLTTDKDLVVNSKDIEIIDINAKGASTLYAEDTIAVSGGDFENTTMNAGTVDVSGANIAKADIYAEDLAIDNSNIDNIFANAGNAEINNSTVTNTAQIDTTEKTTINNLTTEKDLIVNSKDIEITDINAKGDTTLAATDNIKISDGDFANTTMNADTIEVENANINNAALTSNTTNIENMTVEYHIDIASNDVNVSGNMDVIGTADINTTNNIDVTGKITSEGVVDLTADNKVHLSDGKFNSDVNITAPKVVVDEITTGKNINVSGDEVYIATSENINLGTIKGNSSEHSKNVQVDSGKSIFNGKKEGDSNIYSENTTLNAGKTVGQTNKAIGIHLPQQGGNIAAKSKESINVALGGGDVIFESLETSTLVLNAPDNLRVDNLNINNGIINVGTSNVDMTNARIEGKVDIYTKDKHIAIDNTSYKPIFDSTIQLYLQKQPFNLKVDDTNFIVTESLNSIRYNPHIRVNNIEETNSMASTLNTEITNILHNKKTDRKSQLLKTPTLSAYQEEVAQSVEVNKTNIELLSFLITEDNKQLVTDIIDELNNNNPEKSVSNKNYKSTDSIDAIIEQLKSMPVETQNAVIDRIMGSLILTKK